MFLLTQHLRNLEVLTVQYIGRFLYLIRFLIGDRCRNILIANIYNNSKIKVSIIIYRSARYETGVKSWWIYRWYNIPWNWNDAEIMLVKIVNTERDYGGRVGDNLWPECETKLKYERRQVIQLGEDVNQNRPSTFSKSKA